MMKRLFTPFLAAIAILQALAAPVLAADPWLDGLSPHTGPEPSATPTAEPADQRQWYLEQIRRFPDQAALHYQLGSLQFQAGELDTAAASFATALRLEPGLRPASRRLALLELSRRQPEAARQVLEKALGVWGVDPELYYLLGLSYQQLEQPERALAAFERAVLLVPGHPALAYRDTLRRKLPGIRPPEPGPVHTKVQQLLKQKKASEAIQALQTLLVERPDDKAAYAELASALETAGQFAPAAGWREQLFALDPCAGDNAARLGRWLLWSGYLDRASALLQHQLECRPVPDAARWLGQLYRQRQDWEMALAHYSSFLKRWPDDPELLSGQAMSRLSEAGAALKRIKSPGPEALYVRSQLALQSGQPAAAIKDLKQAAATSNRPEYHKALALAYLQAGLGEPAAKELGIYLKQRPAEAAALQPLFQRIKELPHRGRFGKSKV